MLRKQGLKPLLTILLCGWTFNLYAAELLVKADEPWNNEVDASKMDNEQRQLFEARLRKGDIIVVRPDGWQWGREECLPRFIIVKLPGVSIEAAQKYEEPLMEEKDTVLGKTMEIVKHRKHNIPIASVDTAKTGNNSVVSVASKDVLVYMQTIQTKTLSVETDR